MRSPRALFTCPTHDSCAHDATEPARPARLLANGKAIKGATETSLTLKAAQKGKITAKVTARRTGHSNGSAVGKATKTVVR